MKSSGGGNGDEEEEGEKDDSILQQLRGLLSGVVARMRMAPAAHMFECLVLG